MLRNCEIQGGLGMVESWRGDTLMVWNVTLSQLRKRAVRRSRTYHRVLCMFYSSSFSLSEKAVK